MGGEPMRVVEGALAQQIGVGARSGSKRVVVIHAQTLLRQGIVTLLDRLDDFEVAADSGSVSAGIELTAAAEPDVVVLDGDTGDVDVPDVVANLKAVVPRVRVLVVAEAAEPIKVERAIAAGADGYTLKEIAIDEFTDTLRRVAAHTDVYLHPTAAAALVRSIGPRVRSGPPGARLTQRQLEILGLMADGLQNKQIARRLDIGVHTVKTHISRILTKLDAHSRTEAAVIAAREGLISLR